MVEMPDTDDLERALAIRDHLAPLIRKRGEPWPVDGLVWIWEMAPWYMALGTSGSQHALEVLQDERLLRLNWWDGGGVEIVTFERGPWEADALAL
jgi:hypothetical protein